MITVVMETINLTRKLQLMPH